MAPIGTAPTMPQIPRVYKRTPSATKHRVNLVPSHGGDTTQGEVVRGGTLTASKMATPLGGGVANRRLPGRSPATHPEESCFGISNESGCAGFGFFYSTTEGIFKVITLLPGLPA